jgi:hypothetical protein
MGAVLGHPRAHTAGRDPASKQRLPTCHPVKVKSLLISSKLQPKCRAMVGPQMHAQTPGIPDEIDEIDHLGSLKWLLLSCVEQ